MEFSQIGVVVPTFMGGTSLQETISSIRRAELTAQTSVTIIVVDNHPQKFDQLNCENVDHYISLPDNPGFGAACNSGISHLINVFNVDYILLLNPDATLDTEFFVILKFYLARLSTKVTWPIMPLISFDFTVRRIKLDSTFNNENEILTIIDFDDDFTIFDKRGSGIDFHGVGPKKIKFTEFLVLKQERTTPKKIYFFR